MKPNPDDRRNNVERIQHNIDHTIQNIRDADDMIAETDDPELRDDLAAKNARREQALEGLRSEIRDEAEHENRQK